MNPSETECVKSGSVFVPLRFFKEHRQNRRKEEGKYGKKQKGNAGSDYCGRKGVR